MSRDDTNLRKRNQRCAESENSTCSFFRVSYEMQNLKWRWHDFYLHFKLHHPFEHHIKSYRWQNKKVVCKKSEIKHSLALKVRERNSNERNRLITNVSMHLYPNSLCHVVLYFSCCWTFNLVLLSHKFNALQSKKKWKRKKNEREMEIKKLFWQQIWRRNDYMTCKNDTRIINCDLQNKSIKRARTSTSVNIGIQIKVEGKKSRIVLFNCT